MTGWIINTVPLRRNLTCECERLASLAISHASVICARAQVHASGALPTRESKLASVLEVNLARVLASTRKRTREYSQTNSRVLANELASTRKRTREYSQTNSRVYSQTNSRVLAITRVGKNFRGCVEESPTTCWYEETRCHASL